MNEQSSKRMAREKRTVERMVRLYCRKNERHDSYVRLVKNC